MRRTIAARRPGFTLVEMMVALALTILIMTVLATGFQYALQSLSLLKTAGELNDRLHTAETLLRQDLDAPHVEGGSNPGVLRVSDLRFDQPGTTAAALPTRGFFQIRQGSPSINEGLDQDLLSSTRATTHGVSMTVRRTGKTPGDLFTAVDANIAGVFNANPTDVAVASNTYATDWAEVHWFLDTTRPTLVNGVTTFPLCRRVRLLTPNAVGGVAGTTAAEVVSVPPAGGNTNTLEAIRAQANRLGGGGVPASLFGSPPPRTGDDIVLTNVVSFEVKPTWQASSAANSPRINVGVTGFIPNGDFPFDDFPPPLAVTQFDTALGGFAPAAGAPVTAARVTAVQIKIRIYEGRNKTTRQITVMSKL